MFKEVLQHVDLLILPIIGLFIFVTVFAVVVIRTWRQGKNNPTLNHLASLPLQDDVASPIHPVALGGSAHE